MLALLRQRNFRLLWSGGLLSQIGTYMLLAALPYFVYSTSHSVQSFGTAIISETVPAVLFNTIGGVYADRLPRKVVLAAGDGSRGVVLLPLLAVHSASTLWIVYVTGFVSSAIAAFAGPFGTAALPHIVRDADLPSANAAFASATYAAVLMGSPIGGFLLQHVGLSTVVLLDSASFLIPTLAIGLINVPLEERTMAGERAETKQPHVFGQWLLGWRYVYCSSLLGRLFAIAMPVFVGNSLIGVVLVPFVRRVLGGTAEFYSWTLTLEAVSGITAGFLMSRVNRYFGPARLLGVSLVAVGVLANLGVAAASQPVTLCVSAVIGIPILFASSNLTTLLQTGSDPAYRGRISGAYITTVASVSLLGSIFATLVTDRVGIRLMFGLGGLIFIASGAASLRILPHRPGTVSDGAEVSSSADLLQSEEACSHNDVTTATSSKGT
ncbi:MAG TPA: MFS transporter [Chloroflexota bacterium]